MQRINLGLPGSLRFLFTNFYITSLSKTYLGERFFKCHASHAGMAEKHFSAKIEDGTDRRKSFSLML